LVISEVFFNPAGSDDQLEWVELFNGAPYTIDLSEYTLGWGGGAYNIGKRQLGGVVGSGEYFVVGGPTSSDANHNPVFDLAFDFNPDIQNSGASGADAVGLFKVGPMELAPDTVPIDAVIYGPDSASNYDMIDETGSLGAVDVIIPDAGWSLHRAGASTWTTLQSPTPGSGPLTVAPEPATMSLLALGGIAMLRRRRH
jgi:hypothetical protein